MSFFFFFVVVLISIEIAMVESILSWGEKGKKKLGKTHHFAIREVKYTVNLSPSKILYLKNGHSWPLLLYVIYIITLINKIPLILLYLTNSQTKLLSH